MVLGYLRNSVAEGNDYTTVKNFCQDLVSYNIMTEKPPPYSGTEGKTFKLLLNHIASLISMPEYRLGEGIVLHLFYKLSYYVVMPILADDDSTPFLD